MTKSVDAGPVSSSSDRGRTVLVLTGPTASGKTRIALLIARNLDAEIVSADSRQVYKYMDVGTAKPSPEERQLVKHHFVDELNPDQEFNAGEFGKAGRKIIDDILSRHKLPLVVGGSGLYIRSLVDGFFEGPSADKTLRRALYDRLKVEGHQALLSELRKIDPVSASQMLPANTRRIVRALEVHQLTGTPISELQRCPVKINLVPCFAGLLWDRKLLYERINKRVDNMIEHGLVEEAKRLQSRGYSRTLNAFQTVGYKEAFDYVAGYITCERMVDLIKQNSRRFAKRQLTWFRRDNRIRWFGVADEDDFPKVASSISDYFLSGEAAENFE